MHDELRAQSIHGSECHQKVRAHQLLEILAIFATETAVGLPDPVPAWRVPSSSGEEYDRIVRLD